MKRWPVYLALMLLTVIAPVERVNVGNLKPVEVVVIQKQGNEVIVQTDTKDKGQGTDALSALNDMKKNSNGIIYLDTAKYLMIKEDAIEEAKPLQKKLKGNTKVFVYAGELDLENVAKHLDVHGKLPDVTR